MPQDENPDDAAGQLRGYLGIDAEHTDVENKNKDGEPVDTGLPKLEDAGPLDVPNAEQDKDDEPKAKPAKKTAAKKKTAKAK